MTSGSTTEAEPNHRQRAIAPHLEQQAKLAPTNPLLVFARARETSDVRRTSYQAVTAMDADAIGTDRTSVPARGHTPWVATPIPG